MSGIEVSKYSEEELLSVKLRRADWTYRPVVGLIMIKTLPDEGNDSDMTPVTMQEDWVKFTRYPCLEGYVDHWVGDAALNPNYLEKSVSLTMPAHYFRLNGSGKWVCSSYRFLRDLKEYREGFTAEEVFDFIQYESDNKTR